VFTLKGTFNDGIHEPEEFTTTFSINAEADNPAELAPLNIGNEGVSVTFFGLGQNDSLFSTDAIGSGCFA
jgi:hypothetical protein